MKQKKQNFLNLLTNKNSFIISLVTGQTTNKNDYITFVPE